MGLIFPWCYSIATICIVGGAGSYSNAMLAFRVSVDDAVSIFTPTRLISGLQRILCVASGGSLLLHVYRSGRCMSSKATKFGIAMSSAKFVYIQVFTRAPNNIDMT